MAQQHTFYADHLVDALREEGIPANQIWELDGWKENQQGYYWTDVHTNEHHRYDGVANGHLNHHTATTAYTPYVKNSKGQTKANVWLGKRPPGSNRLYQSRDGVPTLAIASAGPANYSAGKGVRDYIKKLNASQEALKQINPDDVPEFYGNRYVLNTEIICDGVGGTIDYDSWELLIVYNAALSRLHDAGHAFNGFHAGFTKRKIDFVTGPYANATETIQIMWLDIKHELGGPMPPEQRYPDVPLDHVFYADIEWLAEAGITKQPPGTLYRPEDELTRGQMAAMLHRYDQYVRDQQSR